MNPCDNAEALLRVLSPARRNHYFYGKRMDVQHFQLEQDYGKHKQWLINRLTLGKGVVCGLRVSIDGKRLCVDPGVAIDGLGREIVVPVRQCIDPLTDEGGCCTPCCEDAQPTPPSGDGTGTGSGTGTDTGGGTVGGANPSDEGHDRARLYTLWLCYKECKTDFEPVLVSECHTRQPCAAGTIVESFCLKVAPGAPLQQDPDWCANLWPHRRPPIEPAPQPPGPPAPATPGGQPPERPPITAAPSTPVSLVQAGANPSVDDFIAETHHPDPGQPGADDLRDALQSRRRILCRLFDGNCDPADEDPCVPLGVFMLRDQRIVRFDACLVRPRIYSNAQLLDLLLCLADRIDECCNGHEPPPPNPDPMRLDAVDFVARLTNGVESPVTTMTNPLVDTPVDINRNMNALRIRFSQAYAQDQRKPSAPVLNDADFKRHNVQILPDSVLNAVPYVAGTLTLESVNVVRFDLSPESPYMRSQGGWQKGRYRVVLRGNENLPANQQALGNTAGVAFDGEAIAPAGGHISGDSTPGGDFVGAFVVGVDLAPGPNLRVRSVDFLLRDGQTETVVASVTSPLDRVTVNNRLSAIRVRFTEALTDDGPSKPTTHGLNDANFERHNVQVTLPPRDATARGVAFLPGTVNLEAPDTLRFDVLRGSRLVDPDGQWPSGTTNFRLVLRGTAGTGKPALVGTDGTTALDGEPIAPSGGVISGDGSAGGDFVAAFAVIRR